MRVLIFTTQFFQLGGAERLAVELALGLNQKGVHADILSLYNRQLPGTECQEMALLDSGVPNIHYLGLKIHPSFFEIIISLRKFRKLINEHKYDIVETSLFTPAVLGSLGTVFSKVNHIVGIHQAYNLRRDNGLKFVLFKWILWLCEKNRYYAISDYVRDSWFKYSGISKNKIKTIYNSIPEKYFMGKSQRSQINSELKLDPEAKIVIYVGRLTQSKGTDFLINSMLPILKENNLVLLLAGLPDFSELGTENMIMSLKNRISTTMMESRVKFLGFRNDIHLLLSTCDLLVHPTQYEGFGLVLVEAMAARIPILTTDVEAIPEILRGCEAVQLPFGDTAKLQQAILNHFNQSPEKLSWEKEINYTRAMQFKSENRINSMIQYFEEVKNNYI